MTNRTVFTGAATAIITPLTPEGIDFERYGAMIDWQIEQGIDAIVAVGTTGEGSTLTDEEHRAAIKYCVERVNGRVPVIAGTGSNDTAYSVDPANVGKILIGNYDFLPCTPAGIMDLLAFYNIDIEGKECVVLGRSNIVGKPMSLLLLGKNGTVTTCHSRTKNLSEVTKRADILVVAIGRAEFVTADMVKPGAVVIDVGINRLANGKLVGDVKFDEVSAISSAITPVPGGVGPMTITTLLKNTLTAARKQNQ